MASSHEPTDDEALDQPPEGFLALNRAVGTYSDNLGRLYRRKLADGTSIVGIRIKPRHQNMKGAAHGGMLMTFIDVALSMNLHSTRGAQSSMATVSLTSDFMAAAMLGDWVEAHVRIGKHGKNLSFGDCQLKVGEKVILRASGVFAVVNTPRKPGFENHWHNEDKAAGVKSAS